MATCFPTWPILTQVLALGTYCECQRKTEEAVAHEIMNGF